MSSDSESTGDENSPPPDEAVTSTVPEEVLPSDIVSTSRSWLYRHSKSPSPKRDSGKKRSVERCAVIWFRVHSVFAHLGFCVICYNYCNAGTVGYSKWCLLLLWHYLSLQICFSSGLRLHLQTQRKSSKTV